MRNLRGRPLLLAALLALLGTTADAKGLSTASLESWLQQYGAAWQARDGAAAGHLFTPDARYHEMPFDEPKKGRAGIEAYWREVTRDQRDIMFKSDVVAVNGTKGVAHWSAEFHVASTGAAVALDGVFILEFDASGQCAVLREWWHVRGGG